MATSIGLKTVGFKEFEELLKPKAFETRLHRNLFRAMRLCAQLAVDEVIRSIYTNSEGFAPKHPWSEVLQTAKGEPNSTRPLVQSGLLAQSVTSLIPDWNRALVGVFRRTKYKSEAGVAGTIANVAEIVHKGRDIRVTPRMRAYFHRLGLHLKPTTRVLHIPPRPFLKVVNSPKMVEQYKAIWARAVERTLRGLE